MTDNKIDVRQNLLNKLRPEEKENDPVHFVTEDDGWYFWDETWSDRFGPFHTELECRLAFAKYCIDFLGN